MATDTSPIFGLTLLGFLDAATVASIRLITIIYQNAASHNMTDTQPRSRTDGVTEKGMSWSPEDTAFVNNILRKNNKPIKTSYKEILQKHESLGY